MRKPHLAILVGIFATVVAPSVARADDGLRLRVDWDALGVVLRESGSSLSSREAPRVPATGQHDVANPETLSSWLGLAPRVSLVARDWGASQILWGQLSLTDQMRLTRSSRMVVSRIRFANGRLVPFAQVGLGEWRVDSALLPAVSTAPHTAAQVGGGFELELAPNASLAAEGDCTMLYQEGHTLDPLATARVWMTMLAARARF